MPRTTHTSSGRPRVSRQVELLLTENVESLGKRGEIVKVRPGYARNYLLPNGYATVATEDNKRRVKRHQENLVALEADRLKQLVSRADAIGKYSVTIEANANEEGHLYGSIMGLDISRALKSAGYVVEADNVRLDGPIKELGMYTVKIHLHQEAQTEVKVWVVPAAKK
ncbi:MAG: 50S ribosomal protein L9 [Planctomycetes bacterium]|nr:50S ribosomal protein L9 [Planctomycetota bacterium]